MIPDAEIISLLCTILSKLDVGEFTVKVRRFYDIQDIISLGHRSIIVRFLTVSLKCVAYHPRRSVQFHLR